MADVKSSPVSRAYLVSFVDAHRRLPCLATSTVVCQFSFRQRGVACGVLFLYVLQVCGKTGPVCFEVFPWDVPWDVPWAFPLDVPWDVPWDVPYSKMSFSILQDVCTCCYEMSCSVLQDVSHSMLQDLNMAHPMLPCLE